MIYNFYKALIWSNIPMALSAVGWATLTFNTLNFEIDFLLLGLSFLFTWSYYSIDRMKVSDADLINNSERAQWYQRNNYYFRILLIIALLLVILILIYRPLIIIPAIIGSIPCVLYAIKMRIGGRYFSLKDLPGMKVILVGILWVLLVVIFPSINTYGFDLPSEQIPYLSAMVACFVMFQININDLRDISGDVIEQTKSFAVMLGAQKSRLIGLLLLLLGYYFGIQLYHYFALMVFILLMAFIQLFYQQKHDFSWRIFIELQGLLAFMVINFC